MKEVLMRQSTLKQLNKNSQQKLDASQRGSLISFAESQPEAKFLQKSNSKQNYDQLDLVKGAKYDYFNE